jgi:type IV pilus assembly protein PilQ
VNTLISGRDSAGGGVPSDGGATGVVQTVGKTASAGGLKVGVVSNDVAVFIRMLDEVTDTTIVSNPKIMALNRQASRVLVGRKVGYLSTTSTDTATTQTVQFLDTGTQLYFRPIVQSDGYIRMELKPQVSEAVIREQTDASGAAVTIPDEITNELTTNVIVKDGQTVVLGGLFRESTKSSRSQVPGLGDIPIIGYAFRGQEDEVQRNEIIFMVTPHLMNDTSLNDQGRRANEYSDRAMAGAREGTLFFSRDRLTGLMNVEAEALAAKGETDKAMWYVQRSLSMNNAQPEVIALREKLTSKKTFWPTRSVLQRVIDGETETVIRKNPGTSMVSAPAAAPVTPAATPESQMAETPEQPVPEVAPLNETPQHEVTEVPEHPTPLPE